MSDSPIPADAPPGLFARIMHPFVNIAETLNDRVYGPYAFGNFLSLNGIWVQRLGILWLTWELTESPTWLGAVAFADLFPLALFAPLAGAAADRWNILNLVRLSNWLTVLQSLALLFLFAIGQLNIAWILFLTTVLAILSALNQPARLAIVPTLVTHERLPTAIAISSLSYNGAQFIGAGIFAFLIPVLGVASTFVFQIGAFIVFGIILIWTRPRADAAQRKKSEGGLFADFREGLIYCWNHVGVRPVMLLLVTIAVGTRATADLFAAFADHVFNGGAEGFGYLTASVGIGAILGILIIAGRNGTKGLVNSVLVFAPGTCVATLIFVSTDMLWVGVIGALFLGFSFMPVAVAAQTLLQAGVDPGMRGRTMALYVCFWRSMPAVGALAMGYAAEFVGLRIPPLVGIVLVFTVVAWLWMRRKIIADALERVPGDAHGQDRSKSA